MSGQRAAGVLLGITRLARFDRRGFAAFPENREAFLSSLAPLLAFALVGAGLTLLHSEAMDAVGELAATICAMLAPAVLSHFFARAWQREQRWLTYATAFNWCQWAIPITAGALVLVAAVLSAAGVPGHVAAAGAIGGVLAYALMLHWFLARYGLALSGWRATSIVIATNLGTALLVLLPRLAVVMAGLDR
jgi:hypothetical protein